jgi:hypothetical protein
VQRVSRIKWRQSQRFPRPLARRRSHSRTETIRVANQILIISETGRVGIVLATEPYWAETGRFGAATFNEVGECKC